MDKVTSNKKKKNNTAFKVVTIVLSIIILITAVFLSTYYFFSKKSYTSYEKNLNSTLKDITKINESMNSFIDGQTIDSNKTKLDLPEKINSLVKHQHKIEQLNPTDKYIKTQETLLQGLTNNILTYKQIIAILNNPEGTDLDISLNNLNNYKEKCITSYSSISNKKLTITLPIESTKFINNTSYFTNQLIKLKKDKDILQSQNNDFINSLNNILSKFISIKTNFYPYVINARNNIGTYDDAIDLANKNKTQLQSIKKDFANITVPAKTGTVYNALKKLIEDYDLYIQNFIFDVTNEKAQPADNKLDKKTADTIYINSNTKLEETNKDYENFNKLFKEFKQSK